jgi:hypothetical protein
MTFTDANPTFPYQSSEASHELGIPDSPEIHLAITSLAERLMPIAEGTNVSDSKVRIAALRTASGGVLFRHPFEEVVIRFRLNLGLHIDQDEIDRTLNPSLKTDWLGQAVHDLKAQGVEIPNGFGQQASNYGWVKR